VDYTAPKKHQFWVTRKKCLIYYMIALLEH